MLRVATAGLTSGEHVLSGDEAHYVHRIHRCQVGDELQLFDPEGEVEAHAVIEGVTGNRVVCRVLHVTQATRRGVDGLRLIQGLGKGDKAEQVVKHAVALGAQSVELVACERSVSRPTERDATKEERLRRVAIDVARQCGRSTIPHVGLNAPWPSVLAHACKIGDVVALHPDGSNVSLERTLSLLSPSVVTIAVGPEGGFSAREVSALNEHGAHFASLGELVLRTELAAVAALARVGAWLSHRRE